MIVTKAVAIISLLDREIKCPLESQLQTSLTGS